MAKQSCLNRVRYVCMATAFTAVASLFGAQKTVAEPPIAPTAAQGAFRFAVLADRTGGHRPGVFGAAIQKVNALRPDVVFCVGDLIEGYTTDLRELAAQWSEFLALTENLKPPFFSVPGNHDISNEVMEREWEKRFGEPYTHVVFRNTLFLLLSTEDPPGGHISGEQVEYFEDVLASYPDVTWTFVLLHEPLWTYDDPSGWTDIEKQLQSRAYTVIAGHMHKYCCEERFGREYFTLATTGGGGPLRGVNYGEFDHLLWITMTKTGPEILNLMLEGIWDQAVYTADVERQMNVVLNNKAFVSAPIPMSKAHEGPPATSLTIQNHTPYLMTISAWFPKSRAMRPDVHRIEAALEPQSEDSVLVSFAPTHAPGDCPPLELAWEATYAITDRPSLTKQGTHYVLFLPPGGFTSEQFQHLDFDALGPLTSQLTDAGHIDFADSLIALFAERASSADDLNEIAHGAEAAGLDEDLARRLGFVTQWKCAGPFPWNPEEGFSHVSDQKSNLARITDTWRVVDTRDALGRVDFIEIFGQRDNATAFLTTSISLDARTKGFLRIGSDDGIRVWVNENLIHEKHAFRACVPDEDSARVTLEKGANSVTVQVTQGIQGWAFCLRFTQEDGAPVPFTYAVDEEPIATLKQNH